MTVFTDMASSNIKLMLGMFKSCINLQWTLNLLESQLHGEANELAQLCFDKPNLFTRKEITECTAFNAKFIRRQGWLGIWHRYFKSLSFFLLTNSQIWMILWGNVANIAVTLHYGGPKYESHCSCGFSLSFQKMSVKQAFFSCPNLARDTH